MNMTRALITAAACIAVAAPAAVGADVGGSDADDLLFGTRGPDVARAGGGDDLVLLGNGRDLAFGGPGADVLMGGRHADALLGQADADVLIGGRGFDVLVGGSGDDREIGGRHADVLYAGAGEDILIGGLGADELYARAADGQVDRLHCGPGRDQAVVRGEDVADRTCERVTIVSGAEKDPGDGEEVPPAA